MMLVKDIVGFQDVFSIQIYQCKICIIAYRDLSFSLNRRDFGMFSQVSFMILANGTFRAW